MFFSWKSYAFLRKCIFRGIIKQACCSLLVMYLPRVHIWNALSRRSFIFSKWLSTSGKIILLLLFVNQYLNRVLCAAAFQSPVACSMFTVGNTWYMVHGEPCNYRVESQTVGKEAGSATIGHLVLTLRWNSGHKTIHSFCHKNTTWLMFALHNVITWSTII